MKKPLVSVVMITYGHETYIREAIEGVLMQECDFDIELIVSNDCSPDKTHEVIKDIINTHPRANIINYFNHKENIGMMPNFLFALKQAKGEYVALCDGDDYWIDTLKLNRQFLFINQNESCVACFENAQIKLSDGTFLRYYYEISEPKKFSPNEMFLLGGSTFPTSTFFFKNCIDYYPDFFNNSHAGDSCLLFLLLDKGNIIYDCFAVSSVYRKHKSGVYTSSNDKFSEMKKSIILYKKVNKFFIFKYNKEINNAIQKQLIVIFNSIGFFNAKNIELLKILNIIDVYTIIKSKFLIKFNGNK